MLVAVDMIFAALSRVDTELLVDVNAPNSMEFMETKAYMYLSISGICTPCDVH